MEKTGRNDPCPCGSGKKFKKCCEAKAKKPKFEATVLSDDQTNGEQNAKKVSMSLFRKAVQSNNSREETGVPTIKNPSA